MKKRPFYIQVLYFLATAIVAMVVLWVLGWLFRPDVTGGDIRHYTAEEIEEVENAREMTFNPETGQGAFNPDVNSPERKKTLVTQDVAYRDFSEHYPEGKGYIPQDKADALVKAGKLPAWYPRHESPILAELVRDGHLPAVAERVGPEPVVLKGCDGFGKYYGGTWLRVASSPGDIGIVSWRMSYTSLARWSPLGYPIKPHVAKSIVASADKKQFVITLRKGMKWSDGEPLTAEDIMYWWQQEVEYDAKKRGPRVIPLWMKVGGKSGKVEKIDKYSVRFVFPAPHGMFMEYMAIAGNGPVSSPAHYLKQYHHDDAIGDKALCEKAMDGYKLPSRQALYNFIRNVQNPEHPRLWPWIYRKYKAAPPQVFVRNPYYFAVDPKGNQLPYVDRLQFDTQDKKTLALSAMNGKITMQTRHIEYKDYTEYMSRRKPSGIRVLHWYPATRSKYAINPNIVRRVDPDRPETQYKADLLADKRFRQALSYAIDRAAIIKAEYNGQVEAAQVSPGPESPFHHQELHEAFTDHDPDEANRMLDKLELRDEELRRDPLLGPDRDSEGYRTFPDGSRMVFYIDFCAYTGVGPTQFVVDDWKKVGIRLIPREQSRPLFYTRKGAMDFDFNIWSAASDYLPLCSPRYFVAHNTECFYAVGYGRWFGRGGFYADTADKEQDALSGNAIRPPRDHPMYQAMVAYDEALKATTLEAQRRIFKKALDIAAENLWTINLTTPPPQTVIVQEGFRNVPKMALYGNIFYTPGNTGIETYYFEDPKDSAGAIADTRQSILKITPQPGASGQEDDNSSVIGSIVQYLLWSVLGLLVVLVAVRHPYIGRRLLIMIPTLLIISVVAFIIIRLPPGDFLATRIMELEESGDTAQVEMAKDLRILFPDEDKPVKRYFRWMGLHWFATGDEKDEGLLQGNMGRSMESTQLVNEMVGNRILLTFLISLGTILFTWAVAIPIGVYSAVKQYSIGDYILTFIGFIGMCVPAFLLALILMAITNLEGLFSAEYAARPEWDFGKVVDLLKHIWIPVLVLGVGGTAGMIRVMRANLLDELKKPYVMAAMAKGVRPMKLLFKYPVRLALNPFISGIGGLFPHLISGGAIVAMVLSLPTVGSLVLSALRAEDTYLSGSLLMVLSLLAVLGTLVSDLLLLWLDPRIRFKGGTR